MKTDLFERGGRATHLAAAGCHSVCGRERQRVKVGSVLGREDTTALHKRSVFFKRPCTGPAHSLPNCITAASRRWREHQRKQERGEEIRRKECGSGRAERNSWNSNYIEEGLPAET